MSEAEFDRMLDAVRMAIEPAPPLDDFLVNSLMQATPPDAPQEAANDNGLVWPLIPFPEGWYAAC